MVSQEALSQQEKELAEERKRQATILDEQRRVLGSLEEMLQKREAALAKAKEEVRNLQSSYLVHRRLSKFGLF